MIKLDVMFFGPLLSTIYDNENDLANHSIAAGDCNGRPSERVFQVPSCIKINQGDCGPAVLASTKPQTQRCKHQILIKLHSIAPFPHQYLKIGQRRFTLKEISL